MKAGLNIQELAVRVSESINERRDLIVRPERLHFGCDTSGQVDVIIEEDQAEQSRTKETRLNPTTHFLRQVGGAYDIPRKYFERMRTDAPDLLTENLNHWTAKREEANLVRTFVRPSDSHDGVARAYLSNRYKRIDNEQVLQEMLPALGNIDGLQIMECELTENRMYIKAITPKIEGEIKRGDAVQAGLVISNSEIGGGALNVSPLVYRLVCLNGLIVPENRFRAFHVGRRHEDEKDVYELFSDETRQADDKAILLKARDVANGIFTQDYFNKLLAPMQLAAEQQVETKRPDLAVEVLAKRAGLNEGEQIDVLTHLLQGGDMTRWGFVNAVTRAAQDVKSYDRSVELEALGGQMLSYDNKAWQEMAEAA